MVTMQKNLWGQINRDKAEDGLQRSLKRYFGHESETTQ